MAKLMLLVALFVLPAIVTAIRPAANPMIVRGRVFCDPCRAGFETPATTYIRGAKVKLECKDKDTMELLYNTEGKTDATGTYTIMVKEDHKDQICDAVLVSSPQTDCASAAPGRERARVILTRYNGIASDQRFANSMGFMKEQVLSGCSQLLKQYQEYDD